MFENFLVKELKLYGFRKEQCFRVGLAREANILLLANNKCFSFLIIYRQSYQEKELGLIVSLKEEEKVEDLSCGTMFLFLQKII